MTEKVVRFSDFSKPRIPNPPAAPFALGVRDGKLISVNVIPLPVIRVERPCDTEDDGA